MSLELSLVGRKVLVILFAIALVSAAAIAAAALPSLNKVTTSPSETVNLPSGCVKPVDGFLIIASQLGFNNSVGHGVPNNSWPVMNARQGQNFTVVICNVDPSQPHGFQIDHYFDARLISIASGQVLTVNFTADKSGTFRVFCSIPCSVHWAMQSGKLVVT
jgi:hypothetical protein